MQSYTNIEQSKKLAEFLPRESADMGYDGIEDRDSESITYDDTATTTPNMDSIPCWSLGALFDLIPSKIYDNNDNYAYLWVHKDKDEQQNKDNHYLAYHDPYDDFEHIETNQYDNFVDACYEMILKLRENNLL